MRGSILKYNKYYNLRLSLDVEEREYLSKRLGESPPKLVLEGTIGGGLIIKFDREGFAVNATLGGAWLLINVARIGAISAHVPSQNVPYTRIMHEGRPALQLAPQRELSTDPSTPERRAIPSSEPPTTHENFNPIPLAPAHTPSPPSPSPTEEQPMQHARPEPRRGIAAGLNQAAVQRIAQKHSSAPIVIERRVPVEPAADVAARVRSFWQGNFDILTLTLSDQDIRSLYQAHRQPEFGKFLDIIKRENEAVTIKAPPLPQSTDKIDDLRTALEMVNTLLDEIGPSVVVKIDPETHRLVARRLRMVEEEL